GGGVSVALTRPPRAGRARLPAVPRRYRTGGRRGRPRRCRRPRRAARASASASRSEEHTSELQSQSNLVCRLLLEKKKTKTRTTPYSCARIPRSHTPVFCV